MDNYVGKTYTFESAAFSGKMLNLYGSASDGKNVVLYDSDGSLEQQWKVVETATATYKLQTMKNTNYVLDRYVGSGNNYNNADVWTASTNSSGEQEILIGQSLGNIVYISMPVYNGNTYVTTYYLTAVSNANGTSSGKTSTSAGNVYWAEPLGNNGGLTSAQKWRMVEVGTASGGDTADTGSGNGTLIVGSRPSTLNYNSDCYGRKFDEGQCTWHAFGRAIEVTGKTITFSATSGLHAKTWWNYVTNCAKSSTPRANSIAVWDDGGTYGHVAYVEAVLDDGTVYYTEANWKGTLDVLDSEDGKVREKSTSAMATRTTTEGVVYNLLGYLYL